MPDLSPADVERLRAHALGVAFEEPPQISGIEAEAAAQVRRYREWCEFRRKRQAEMRRVTPTEDLRAYAEAYTAMEERCRYQDGIIRGMEDRNKWLVIAVLILVPLAIAGWGRG